MGFLQQTAFQRINWGFFDGIRCIWHSLVHCLLGFDFFFIQFELRNTVCEQGSIVSFSDQHPSIVLEFTLVRKFANFILIIWNLYLTCKNQLWVVMFWSEDFYSWTVVRYYCRLGDKSLTVCKSGFRDESYSFAWGKLFFSK